MLSSRGSRKTFTSLAAAARISLVIGATFAASGSAGATSITSTTFSSWKATLTGAPSEANFSVISLTSYNTAAGLTLPTIGNSSIGTTVTGPDNGQYQMSGVDYKGFTSLAGSTDSGAGLDVAMPNSGVNAFLLSVGSTGGTPLTLKLSDGETFTVQSGVWGISISHPVSSLFVTTSAGSEAVLDDFWYGSSNMTQDPSTGGSGGPAPVAEVASSLMIAGGCLFLVGVCRRFRQANPA
jgi:hypothetical protein